MRTNGRYGRKVYPPTQAPTYKDKPVPAPIGGWNSAQSIAAATPGTAIVLDNFFPTRTGIQVRGGSTLYATLGTEPVESFISYIGNTRQFFAASDGNIYPITSVADPEVAPTPDVTGQTSDYYSSINFATTGGNFLYAVNGTDLAELYDGTSWTAVDGSSTPAVTGVSTDVFTQVNTYRNRLYFVEANSLNVWYLPVDSIGGAASVLSLAGIFDKGGFVHFTATWSSETGASSISSYLVVMSTEGQAAVFTGSFPGGTDWSFQGCYDISKAMGKNAWFRAGGDIIILTEQGMVPVSAARYKDPAALGLDAISKAIEPDWRLYAQQRGAVPWEVVKWDRQARFYVNCPIASPEQPKATIVGNLLTGALSRYTNWDTRCLGLHAEQAYFGTNDGTIYQAEVGGTDAGIPYTSQVAFAWDHLGPVSYTKTVKQAQAVFTTKRNFSYRLSDSVAYNQVFPSPPNSIVESSTSSEWDVGLFDVAVYDQGQSYYTVKTRWRSIGMTGDVHSLQVQVANGGVNTPSAELILMHVTYEMGALAV